MKSENASRRSSTMMSSKSSPSSRLDQMSPLQKSMHDDLKRSLCSDLFSKESSMSCCLLLSNEPSQLCLGPEFCRHPQLRFKGLTSTSNTSPCSSKPSLQQLLLALSAHYKWPAPLPGSTPGSWIISIQT